MRIGGAHRALAVAVVLTLAAPGQGGLVPGGGRPASDCYGEFNVEGATGTSKIVCTDGDPACDTDGQCQGACTFRVALCLNQANVPACTPKPLAKPAKVRGASLSVAVPTDASPV